MPDRTRRLEVLADRMSEAGVDLLFLPVSADLEYLTGLQRRVMTFGNVEYTHHWVAGWFFAPGREPVYVLPRMVSEFDLPSGFEGEARIVRESDDGSAIFEQVVHSFGPVGRVAVGARTWAETTIGLTRVLPGSELLSANQLLGPMRAIKDTDELAAMSEACRIVDDVMAAVSPEVLAGASELELARDVDFLMMEKGSRTSSFDTGVWSMGPTTARDATVRVASERVAAGLGVSFDFGAVVGGYCSDFGRTIAVGEAPPGYEKAYDLVMEAQAAGIRAVRPGVTAASVHEATRKVIVDGGYGDWFRHRTGHCIGLDVHEHPFISEEDETVLEAGMTFTIEPSIFWPGHVGVRVEDIIVCEETGGRKLNDYPTTLVVNG